MMDSKNFNGISEQFKELSKLSQLNCHSLTTDLRLILLQLERRINEKNITLTEAYTLINQAEYIIEASLR
ncbi:hypothetical protein Psal006b_01959 [Piscirickettsia salmonis]|uniref:Uncharacterized protein n=2 Tax=Piscirickettsia salmonis TaxID=1238 RepID=A0AAC8VHF8_PISSA|nr:hypothetical protein [Piscirickettsia salmonis]ALB22434.1 hypothetical protein KU39_1252 [Piscirickettsia salmonis]QGN98959.1 hypothetical protein Psal006b_01959 [Piscirickettsia salmonis]QGO02590.1 hypothetical protein Psal008_01979 [Piscirickettsia salmonis]QGO13256.1 hypothetical protein Psal010b_01956 [Piscirickettsia salmonis]QGO20326.1 hypothetical protein Psal013_01986 [Piscirickettsia salmonis]